MRMAIPSARKAAKKPKTKQSVDSNQKKNKGKASSKH